MSEKNNSVRLIAVVASLAILVIVAILVFLPEDKIESPKPLVLSAENAGKIEEIATTFLTISTNFGAESWDKDSETFMEYYRSVLRKERWLSSVEANDKASQFFTSDAVLPKDETSSEVYDYVDTVGRRSSNIAFSTPDDYFTDTRGVPTVVLPISFESTYHFYRANFSEEGKWDSKSFVDTSMIQPVSAKLRFVLIGGEWKISEVYDVSAVGAFVFDTRFADLPTTDTPFTVPDHPVLSDAAIALGESKGAPGYDREACILYGSACGEEVKDLKSEYTAEAEKAYEEYMKTLEEESRR